MVQEKLTKGYEYREVYKKGRSFANKDLVIYVLKRNDSLKRMGISINKKIGNAVRRNRLKRIIKEVFRLNKNFLESGLDLVFIVRRGISVDSYKEMEKVVVQLFKKAKIVDNSRC